MARNQSSVGRRRVQTEVRRPLETVISRIVMYFFTVIEIFIGARFVLRLFAANPEAGVVDFIYRVSDIFMAPFEAIFGTTEVVEGSVVEWSALAAIAGYAILAWGITALIGALSPRRRAESVEEVVEQDDTQQQL